MAHMRIEHSDRKRTALGIDKAMERVLFDMAAGRELEAVSHRFLNLKPGKRPVTVSLAESPERV